MKNMDSAVRRSFKYLRNWGTSFIHWKAQFMANFLFGLPSTLIAAFYIGIPRFTLLRLGVFFVLFSAIVWGSFWFFFSQISACFYRKDIDSLLKDRKLTQARLLFLLKWMIKFPAYLIVITFFVTMIAYISGMILAVHVFLPEFQQIAQTVYWLGAGVGVIVALVEAILSYTFATEFFRPIVNYILILFEGDVRRQFGHRRITILQKIWVAIFFSTISAQIMVFSLVIGRVSLVSPEEVNFHLTRLGLLFLSTTFFAFFIARHFTKVVYGPMQDLAEWSKKVIAGDLEAKVISFTDDESTDIVGYVEQMADQLKSEKKLVTAERNKLAVVLSEIVDGVVALDAEYKIVFFNQSAEEISGLSEKEVAGKHVDRFLCLVGNDGKQVFSQEYCHFSKEPEKFIRREMRLMTREDDFRYINFLSVPVEESQLSGVSYILTFHDITEERDLERMKLDFVAMAAHELRTPLTAIMGYLQVVIDEAGESLTPEHQTFLSRSLTSGQRLNTLMENLLSITRIERGETKIKKRPVVWGNLIQERIDEFSPLAKEKGLQFVWRPPKEPFPLARVDPMRISEVLNNLINNAITYTQKGEVEIWCKLNEKGDRIITSVRDTGQGIPKDSLPHLFEKFYRVMGPLEEGSKGTGLGLYISKSIVQMHGGDIWVKSELGKGSVFSFSVEIAGGGITV